MSDLLQLLPIFTFMLIPVWIPLIAMVVGALSDLAKAPKKVAGARSAAPARSVSPAGRPVPAAGTAR